MHVKEISNFFDSISRKFIRTSSVEEKQNMDKIVVSKQSKEEDSSEEVDEKINLAQRTLMARLYELEQDISVFEGDFPTEFEAFKRRINEIRESYQLRLEEIKKLLRFEIDPEIDSLKLGEVVKLEKDIEIFIESEAKFKILSKRLQTLIRKLNILYNVSIFHSSECEKEKVQRQLKNAFTVEEKLAKYFKSCGYILSNVQYKERVVSLFSYAEYEMIKIGIRNSNTSIEELAKNLALFTDFSNFNYESSFIAFIKDEVTDLEELISLVTDRDIREALKTEKERLMDNLLYTNTEQNILSNIAFWNQFLSFETVLLKTLKAEGVEKEKTKIMLLERMEISIKEDEVFTLPITNAYMELINLFSATQDFRILLLIKMLRNASKDITYKEIYFLAILFDAMEVIEEKPNNLLNYMQKYMEKYPYNQSTIIRKKQLVIKSPKKEYVVAFLLDNQKKEIIKTLEILNIDFKVEDDKLLINSFYFNDMPNLLANMQVSNYTL